MELAKKIVDYAVSLDYDRLSASTISATKQLILDSLANIVAGSMNPKTRICADYFKGLGGRGESTLLVLGGKLPAPSAAFVNGVMAHVLDFDDVHSNVQFHAMSSIFPAALAGAEERGGVNGRLFITSIVLGTDVGSRIALAMMPGVHIGWLPATVSGGLGSVIALGKVIGLDSDKLLSGLGIQYGATHGNRQALMDRAGSKHILPAFSAQSAVISTYLARGGMDGPKNIFRGDYGLANLFCEGKLDEEALLRGLGTSFETECLGIKPYPSCRETHASIDAALKLYHAHGVRAEEIKSVEVTVPDTAFEWCGRPFEITSNLQMASQFSIPYTVAVALTTGNVRVKDVMPEEILKSDSVRGLAEKVKVARNDRLVGKKVSVPVEIRVERHNGETLSEEVQHRKGDAEYPITMDECRDKFLLCWQDAGLEQDSGEEVIRYVEKMEELADVSDLADAMIS